MPAGTEKKLGIGCVSITLVLESKDMQVLEVSCPGSLMETSMMFFFALPCVCRDVPMHTYGTHQPVKETTELNCCQVSLVADMCNLTTWEEAKAGRTGADVIVG